MSDQSDKIDELNILLDSKSNIFNSDSKYVIPLYQRAYAWSDKEITQLMAEKTALLLNIELWLWLFALVYPIRLQQLPLRQQLLHS
jgi:hypothetical protein